MFQKFRVVIIVVIFLILLSVFSFLMLGPRNVEAPVPPPDKHFGLIAGNVHQPLWRDIYKGIQQYAVQNQIAVELFGPEYFDLQEHIRWMKIAMACRLDGLIFPAYMVSPYTELIGAMKEESIPAVTVIYDLPESGRDSFVGIDPEELGSAAALLIDHATEGRAEIAVIKNSLLDENGIQDTRDPLIQGIVNAAGKRDGLEVAKIESSPFGIFSTEQISRDILKNNPNINAFFCDSVYSTLGVTQMVVDLNLVGRIAIVGFMRNDDIDRYLQNGIVNGVIHTDSYEIGRSAISILHDLSENRETESMVKIGFSVLFSDGEGASGDP